MHGGCRKEDAEGHRTVALILKNEAVASGIYRMKVEGNFPGNEGQFYMLKPDNTFLAKPISIHDIENDSITFLYQAKGKGTGYLSEMAAGRDLELFGPMGNGFEIDRDADSICLIGGGIGTAPLYLLARRIRENHPEKHLAAYLGFTSESYLTEEFEELCDEVTVDVGGIITDMVDFEAFDRYYACGPDIMMKSAVMKAMEKDAAITVSLESRMACGVGACLGCNVQTPQGNVKVCKDGPVFDGRRIYGE